jgi:outer membrane protein OmpA-like peptidoglycan-associated protein
VGLLAEARAPPAHFAYDSSVIEPRSFETLDQAARILHEYSTLALEISGHTDATGTRDHNLELAAARAEAVKAYLVAKGIAGSRLRTIGIGPDRPLTTNDTEEGRARNRRIEFRLLSPAE